MDRDIQRMQDSRESLTPSEAADLALWERLRDWKTDEGEEYAMYTLDEFISLLEG